MNLTGNNIISEGDLKNTDQVITMEELDEYNKKINIPDVTTITSEILQVLEYMGTDEMIQLREKNEDEHDIQIRSKFPLFYQDYYSIYKMILSGSDISYLFEMLRALDGVKRGKVDYDKVEKDIGDKLNNKYIIPNIPNQPTNKTSKRRRKR